MPSTVGEKFSFFWPFSARNVGSNSSSNPYFRAWPRIPHGET